MEEEVQFRKIEPTKKASLGEVFSKIGSGNKLTGADILNRMADNIHMKSDIASPLAYTAMHVIADWEGMIGEEETAKIDRKIAEYGEQFSVARNGKRADKIISAVESVLTQEHEIAKAQAKRLV